MHLFLQALIFKFVTWRIEPSDDFCFLFKSVVNSWEKTKVLLYFSVHSGFLVFNSTLPYVFL